MLLSEMTKKMTNTDSMGKATEKTEKDDKIVYAVDSEVEEIGRTTEKVVNKLKEMGDAIINASDKAAEKKAKAEDAKIDAELKAEKAKTKAEAKVEKTEPKKEDLKKEEKEPETKVEPKKEKVETKAEEKKEEAKKEEKPAEEKAAVPNETTESDAKSTAKEKETAHSAGTTAHPSEEKKVDATAKASFSSNGKKFNSQKTDYRPNPNIKTIPQDKSADKDTQKVETKPTADKKVEDLKKKVEEKVNSKPKMKKIGTKLDVSKMTNEEIKDNLDHIIFFGADIHMDDDKKATVMKSVHAAVGKYGYKEFANKFKLYNFITDVSDDLSKIVIKNAISALVFVIDGDDYTITKNGKVIK